MYGAVHTLLLLVLLPAEPLEIFASPVRVNYSICAPKAARMLTGTNAPGTLGRICVSCSRYGVTDVAHYHRRGRARIHTDSVRCDMQAQAWELFDRINPPSTDCDYVQPPAYMISSLIKRPGSRCVRGSAGPLPTSRESCVQAAVHPPQAGTRICVSREVNRDAGALASKAASNGRGPGRSSPAGPRKYYVAGGLSIQYSVLSLDCDAPALDPPQRSANVLYRSTLQVDADDDRYRRRPNTISIATSVNCAPARPTGLELEDVSSAWAPAQR
ncbi:hypothetical protein BV20DRAFT_390116 [Pilatotrama ljubarskyi]|nr:hypothetical protein BV20DRAFT_390116 [Pilatotrama ljubarskyi]